MGTAYNIYVDESCHLQKDHGSPMVVGALLGPTERTYELASTLRDLKEKHGLARHAELKWTRVSPSKADLFREIIELFLNDQSLRFRTVIVPNKELLDHDQHATTGHDEFYYKMAYLLLKPLVTKTDSFNIYFDVTDTNAQRRADVLAERLRALVNDNADKSIIRNVQPVHSHHVEQVQLCDLLVGAVAYRARQRSESATKLELVTMLETATGSSLDQTTALRQRKVNVLRWKASTK